MVGGGWRCLGSALHRLSDPEPGGGGHRPTTGVPGHLSRRFAERPVGGQRHFFRCVHADPADQGGGTTSNNRARGSHARKSTIQAWLEFDRGGHTERGGGNCRGDPVGGDAIRREDLRGALAVRDRWTLGVRSDGGWSTTAGSRGPRQYSGYGRAGDRERRKQ